MLLFICGDNMIDTHTHLYKDYYENIESEIKKITDSGVEKLIVCSVNKKSAEEAKLLSEKYDFIYFSVGVQPEELEDVEWIKDYVSHPRVVAIGEIGLDYHYDMDREKQKEILKKQLDIASEYDKPVIIHCRDSYEDMVGILSGYKLRGVIHSFTGSVEEARRYISMGYYLGLNGIITFKNATEIREVVRMIDLRNILVETDSPYLSPEPYRGRKNSSSNLGIIIEKIAEIKKMDACKVEQITNDNAISLFDIIK